MAEPSTYSTLSSRYDDFLFTNIGEQRNGMPLSMASALTRLGLDPWDEADRLATLPGSVATTALAQMIARAPDLASIVSEIPKLSARLIDLLPKSDAVSPPTVRTFSVKSWQVDARWKWVVLAVGAVAVLARIFWAG